MVNLERESAIELFGAAALTVLLFQIDVFYAVFTVPLHVVALKRTDRLYLAAAALTALAIGIQESIRFAGLGVDGDDALIMAVAVFAPVTLLSGTVIYHLVAEYGVRRLYRFLGSLSASALFGLVLVLVYEGDSTAAVQAREGMREQFTLLMQIGQQSGMGMMFSAEQAELFYHLTVETIKRSFLLGTAIQMGFAVHLAQMIDNRRRSRPDAWLYGFHAPEQFVWPFLISWAVVLLSLLTDIGILGVIGWNSALVFSFVYFVQGCAIAAFLLRRRGVRLSPVLVVLLLILAVAVPGVNVLIMIGVPLFGVSEIWIQYRVVKKEHTDENNS